MLFVLFLWPTRISLPSHTHTHSIGIVILSVWEQKAHGRGREGRAQEVGHTSCACNHSLLLGNTVDFLLPAGEQRRARDCVDMSICLNSISVMTLSVAVPKCPLVYRLPPLFPLLRPSLTWCDQAQAPACVPSGCSFFSVLCCLVPTVCLIVTFCVYVCVFYSYSASHFMYFIFPENCLGSEGKFGLLCDVEMFSFSILKF